MFGTLGAGTGIAIAWTLVAVTRGFLPESFVLQTLNPLNVDYRAIGTASSSTCTASRLWRDGPSALRTLAVK